MFVVHCGYVADGLHYAGAIRSTKELALDTARIMATEELDDSEEITVEEFDEVVVANGYTHDGEEIEYRVQITELAVDGKEFHGSID